MESYNIMKQQRENQLEKGNSKFSSLITQNPSFLKGLVILRAQAEVSLKR